MTPEQAPLDVRGDALRLLTNGLYVLTTCVDDVIHSATVAWVTQVSAEPALLLVALRRNSHLAQAVRRAHRFALNILAADQPVLAEQFFNHLSVPSTSPNLSGFAFREGAGHCPLLTDTLAWLECRLAAEPESPGDHALIVGEITATGVRREGAPLVLGQTIWSYGGLTE